MKHLIIRNFGPIDEVDIQLKRVNLIIGPQSSGKSCVLKTACYCDWVERQVELTQTPEKYCEYQAFIDNLLSFHRLQGYLKPNTYIKYENDAATFEFSEQTKECSFAWREAKRWDYKKTKIAYIPAERNLVAAIPNWFQVSMNKDNILDFMKEWEFARRTFVKEEQILDLPVKYRYNPVNQSDHIALANGQELDLNVASSGLQSLTPLYVMVRYLTSIYFSVSHDNVEQSILRDSLMKTVAAECHEMSATEQLSIVNSMLTAHHTDLYVEEPEAHIFPSTQRSLVYALVGMLNENPSHSCFLATHSPYIMTAFNNLILAGDTAAESVEKSEKVAQRIPLHETLQYDDVAAFQLKNGMSYSIMDDEFKLISAEALDE